MHVGPSRSAAPRLTSLDAPLTDGVAVTCRSRSRKPLDLSAAVAGVSPRAPYDGQ
jgi:hypothetical protein